MSSFLLLFILTNWKTLNPVWFASCRHSVLYNSGLSRIISFTLYHLPFQTIHLRNVISKCNKLLFVWSVNENCTVRKTESHFITNGYYSLQFSICWLCSIALQPLVLNQQVYYTVYLSVEFETRFYGSTKKYKLGITMSLIMSAVWHSKLK